MNEINKILKVVESLYNCGEEFERYKSLFDQAIINHFGCRKGDDVINILKINSPIICLLVD